MIEHKKIVPYILMALAVVFALIDNLFIGYFIWHFYGLLAFSLMVSLSIPVTTVYRYASYETLGHLETIYSPLKEHPYLIILLLAIIYCAFSFYSVLYGAMFIQIVKLLVNEMGISMLYAMPITNSLVVTALLPESINWVTSVFNNIYNNIKHVYENNFEIVIDNNNYYLSTILFTVGLFVCLIFCHIEYTQVINGYQHYLVEFCHIVMPVIAEKGTIMLVLFYNFISMLIPICTYCYNLLNANLPNPNMRLGKTILFTFIALVRGFSRSVLTGELASNPFNLNAKNWAIFQSVSSDFQSMIINGDNQDQAQEEMRRDFVMMLRLMLLTLSTIFFLLITCHVIVVPWIMVAPIVTMFYVGGFYYTQIVCNFFFSQPLTSNLINKDQAGVNSGLDLRGLEADPFTHTQSKPL